MKKLLILNISKIKMNFKKANIIIVTLFIIIFVWVLGLITTKYVLNLINVSSENKKYYKAYYIGYAGLELELLKNKNHGYGFEDSILSGSDTVLKNFTWKNYNFDAKILSMSKYITNNYKTLFNPSLNCSDRKNWISLGTGDGLMVPLYYDKNTGEAKFWTWNENYNIVDFSNATLYYDGSIVATFNKKKNINEDVWWWNRFVRNWNGNISLLTNLGSPSYTADDKPFLVVWAQTASKICIENSSNKMVTPHTYIVSQGSYLDRSVLVKVVKYNKWASFSVFGIY